MLNHELKHKMIEQINKKRWTGSRRSQSFVYLLDNLQNLNSGIISAKEIIQNAETIRNGEKI
ncbi:MAG: hypothetical protein K0S93_55 [Nitrososphaeraceae archaeon]|jgi:hypothetical protein|nr:hypothetical protein [Nitrososphaeraceae archaeon]